MLTSLCSTRRVPTLEDPNTGVVSWESLACMNYVLRVYDKSNKFGAGESEQDKVDFDKWTSFLVSTVGPMMGQTNWYRHYNATKNEDALERYVQQTYRCYDVLEGQLAATGGKSVLEKGYTAVDMHFYAWVFQYGYAQLSIDKYTNIQKWLKQVGGREAVKKAYEKIPAAEHAASGGS